MMSPEMRSAPLWLDIAFEAFVLALILAFLAALVWWAW